VPQVWRHGIVKAMADERLQLPLEDDLPVHRQNADQIRAID
jgi:hypothetical protein